jgi:hypothetical protein
VAYAVDGECKSIPVSAKGRRQGLIISQILGSLATGYPPIVGRYIYGRNRVGNGRSLRLIAGFPSGNTRWENEAVLV